MFLIYPDSLIMLFMDFKTKPAVSSPNIVRSSFYAKNKRIHFIHLVFYYYGNFVVAYLSGCFEILSQKSLKIEFFLINFVSCRRASVRNMKANSFICFMYISKGNPFSISSLCMAVDTAPMTWRFSPRTLTDTW